MHQNLHTFNDESLKQTMLDDICVINNGWELHTYIFHVNTFTTRPRYRSCSPSAFYYIYIYIYIGPPKITFVYMHTITYHGYSSYIIYPIIKYRKTDFLKMHKGKIHLLQSLHKIILIDSKKLTRFKDSLKIPKG